MATLTIHGNTFTPRSPSVSIVGQVNAEQVTFVVDESWSDLELQAQFSNAAIDREPVPVALDETMTCFVPSEATAQPGKVYVALAGYNDGVQIKLTGLLHYSNAKAGADPNGGVPPEEQTPGYLNQITQILNETKAVAQSVRDDADQGKFDGKPGKNGEPGKSPKEEGGTWWLWNEGEQKWIDTGILAAGKNGISPKVATQPVTGGTRVIITDADGEKSFDVLNGKNGNPGKNGETPNITIGRVDTLPSGSKATAEITGQTPNLTLNMGIPKGREGPAGLGVPTPTQEDAGKVPMVNLEGDGYILGEAGGGNEQWSFTLNETITVSPAVRVISRNLPTGTKHVVLRFTVAAAAVGNIYVYFNNDGVIRQIPIASSIRYGIVRADIDGGRIKTTTSSGQYKNSGLQVYEYFNDMSKPVGSIDLFALVGAGSVNIPEGTVIEVFIGGDLDAG